MKSKKTKLIAAAMALVITAGSASVFANTTMSGKIGLERAKQIALEDAKVKATEASFVRAKLDKDDGYPVYDVEFYKGNVEYDYEIDAKTGAIREKDRDIEHYVIGGKKQAQVAQPQAQPKANTKAAANKAITVEAAKEIAQAHAGLKASQVQFVKAELDGDDSVKHYDIEFYANGKEYDYEIDFQSGKLLSVDYDLEYDRKVENDDAYDDRDDRDDRFEDDRYDDRDDLDGNRDDLYDRCDDRDDADDRYDDRDDDQDDREYDNDRDDDND